LAKLAVSLVAASGRAGVSGFGCGPVTPGSPASNHRHAHGHSLSPLPDGDHPVEGPPGAFEQGRGDLDHVPVVAQRRQRLLDRDLVHVRAADAAQPEDVDAGRAGRRKVVPHGALGQQEQSPAPEPVDVSDHLRRSSGNVRGGDDLRTALGMGQDDDVRKLAARALDVLDRELLVNLAAARPADQDLGGRRGQRGDPDAAGIPDGDHGLRADLARRVAGEKFVREEDHPGVSGLLETADDRRRVPRRAAFIRLRLHLRVGVDIADDGDAGEEGLERPHVVRPDALRQRAPGLRAGEKDEARGIQDLRRLGHEPHAAEDDAVGVGAGRDAAEVEGVPREVRDRMVQGRFHVVVPEDHGPLLALEPVDLARHFRLDPELDVGDRLAQEAPEALVGLRHAFRIGQGIHGGPLMES
jgi:hypothetical protein